jgi:hypothetical protein
MSKLYNHNTSEVLGKLPQNVGPVQVLRIIPERNEMVVKGRFNNELMVAKPYIYGLDIISSEDAAQMEEMRVMGERILAEANEQTREQHLADARHYNELAMACELNDPAFAMLRKQRDHSSVLASVTTRAS